MNKIKTSIIAMITLMSLSVAQAHELTYYQDYLNEHNLDIQKSRLDYDTASLNYKSTQIDTHPSSSSNTFELSKTNHQQKDYSLNASISYELDIWGRLKENEKAKFILIQSASASLEDTKNNIFYKFINSYLQLAYTKEKIAIEKQKLDIYQQKLSIYQAQFNAGLITSDQVLILRNSLTDTQTTIASLIDTTNTLINTLNVLLNNQTGNDKNVLEEPNILENWIKINHPNTNIIDSLNNNPSIRSSLLNVLSDKHMVSYNQKAYYPTINLGGNLTTSALKISSLLLNPITTILSSVTFNFNFNEIKNDIDLSKNSEDIALNNYQATYLSAFNNIKENLAKYDNNTQAYKQMSEEKDNYQKVVTLYTTQYKLGYLAYTSLLDEKILLLNSEENMLTYQLNQQTALNQLNYLIVN